MGAFPLEQDRSRGAVFIKPRTSAREPDFFQFSQPHLAQNCSVRTEPLLPKHLTQDTYPIDLSRLLWLPFYYVHTFLNGVDAKPKHKTETKKWKLLLRRLLDDRK